MDKPLQAISKWLGNALATALTAPLDELKAEVKGIKTAQDSLAKAVESKHKDDPSALECDLSLLDDRICYLIDKARERGYTTAGERRRVDRMHQAYQSRGGNHGEEQEYKRYCNLPTEEEWKRMQV